MHSNKKASSVESLKKQTSYSQFRHQHRPSVVSRDNDDDDEDDSGSSSVNIGKGGNKFMKKRPESAPEIPTVQHSRTAAVEKPR